MLFNNIFWQELRLFRRRITVSSQPQHSFTTSPQITNRHKKFEHCAFVMGENGSHLNVHKKRDWKTRELNICYIVHIIYLKRGDTLLYSSHI